MRAERRLIDTYLTIRQRLPEATTKAWGWQLQAHCRGTDPAIFFPTTHGKHSRARANDEARAKQVCHQCPVLPQCRRHALDTAEPHGIWGGLTPLDRALHLARTRPPTDPWAPNPPQPLPSSARPRRQSRGDPTTAAATPPDRSGLDHTAKGAAWTATADLTASAPESGAPAANPDIPKDFAPGLAGVRADTTEIEHDAGPPPM